ncbi:MAG TPA: 4Fe-4S binding protein [Negativicutes bacterium]|nr:4Fe-4S binding protein [Negativicutes bacterium]
MRRKMQASAFLLLIITVAIYKLYINGIIDFRLFGIADLNPYGGWTAIHAYTTDSSYVFEGIGPSVALTIALIALCLAGGRFFCGWLCPLGAAQDFTAWLGKCIGLSAGKYHEDKYTKLLFVKYAILLAVLLASILGYGAVLAGFSPWRALLDLPGIASGWRAMEWGYLILAGILVAPVFIGRAFCRYLCPLGAAQALVSSLSLSSMKYGEGCTQCNACLRSCPAGIKLTAGTDTISPECIRCMECVEDCRVIKDSGIHTGFRHRNMSQAGYAALMLALFALIWLGMPQIYGKSYADVKFALGTLKDGTYKGEADGFAGNIVTEVTIGGGKITDIRVIKHQESKGWYEEPFMVLPGKIIARQRLEVDSISGATKTSRGLVKSVENAIKQAQ